jgi:hypothetical protein
VVIAKPKTAESAGTPVVHQNVGVPNQLLKSLFASGVAQVYRNAFLVAVYPQEPGAGLSAIFSFDEWTAPPRQVSGTRTLDFYYVCAHIS